MRPLFALLLSLFISLPAQAGWYLDNESSRLSFISTQGGEVAEVHRFLTLHGQVLASGTVRVRVDLDSLSTGVPLRDERLRTELFAQGGTPEAHLEGQVALEAITALAPGAQLELRMPLSLTLNGQKQSLAAELLVTRLDDQRFQVVTLAPLVLQADAFGLQPGLEALGKSAGVPAIGLAVPVSAVLIFTER
ncbi:MAG: YceI family protein [Pseudomonas sp.]|uniref:YceI family protein n=1 Tax=Pseudomonas sp. TaxID=306 RepID=UPI0033963EE0